MGEELKPLDECPRCGSNSPAEPSALRIALDETLIFLGALANHQDERDEWEGRDLFRDWRDAAGPVLERLNAAAASPPLQDGEMREKIRTILWAELGGDSRCEAVARATDHLLALQGDWGTKP